MKLHISTEQLNELSDESYSKLCAYVVGSRDHFVELDPTEIDVTVLLQFIEQANSLEAYHLLFLRQGTEVSYGLEVKIAEETRQFKEREVVDALWGAVKEILLSESAEL